jgi:hypothetical protein
VLLDEVIHPAIGARVLLRQVGHHAAVLLVAEVADQQVMQLDEVAAELGGPVTRALFADPGTRLLEKGAQRGDGRFELAVLLEHLLHPLVRFGLLGHGRLLLLGVRMATGVSRQTPSLSPDGGGSPSMLRWWPQSTQ